MQKVGRIVVDRDKIRFEISLSDSIGIVMLILDFRRIVNQEGLRGYG